MRPYGTCNGDISMTADNAYVLYINGMAQVSVNRGNAVDNIAGCDARCVPVLPRPPVGVPVPSHVPYNRHTILAAVGVLRLREGPRAGQGVRQVEQDHREDVQASVPAGPPSGCPWG